MATDLATIYLDAVRRVLQQYQRLGERAIAQAPDAALALAPDPESNSIAVLVRHLAGNMRSRFTDFLTTDGEKPDRQRDREFEPAPADRAALLREWEDGWRHVHDAIAALRPEDLTRQVGIRSEVMPVPLALERALAHYASHVGQIVYLAKHYAGDSWRTLSIPRPGGPPPAE